MTKEQETEVIPVAEEEARIETREVLTGRVVVETAVEDYEQVVRETLQGEDVNVVRIPKDEVVSTAPQIRTDGNVTIIPILEEVLFVEKRLVLKEEVRIESRKTTEEVEVPVVLRRQRADIRREPGTDEPATKKERRS